MLEGLIMECPDCGGTQIEKQGDDYVCCGCGYRTKQKDELERELAEQAENVSDG